MKTFFFVVLAFNLLLLLYFIIMVKSSKPPKSNLDKFMTPQSNSSSLSTAKPSTRRSNYAEKIKLPLTKNNMNYDEYIFSAKYSKTKRMHKNKSIIVMDGQNVKSCILDLGYEEPISYEKFDFPSPDYDQLRRFQQVRKYVNPRYFLLPNFCSYQDAEALIERYEYDYDIKGRDIYSPNPNLVEYATEMGIKFSYFIGKKHLYQLIFNSLDIENKIAFYTFCVYKDQMQKKDISINRNPKSCEHYNDFIKFAKSKLTDKTFIDSLSEIKGYTLRFFGPYDYYGRDLNGGDTETVAYKETYDFLKTKNLI